MHSHIFVVFHNEHGFFDDFGCYTSNVSKARNFDNREQAEAFRKSKYAGTSYTTTISILEWM